MSQQIADVVECLLTQHFAGVDPQPLWEKKRSSNADTVENFQAALNKLGGEGWEATSGTYAIGESKKVTLGQGMAPSMAAGVSTWVALMKRAITN